MARKQTYPEKYWSEEALGLAFLLLSILEQQSPANS